MQSLNRWYLVQTNDESILNLCKDSKSSWRGYSTAKFISYNNSNEYSAIQALESHKPVLESPGKTTFQLCDHEQVLLNLAKPQFPPL